MPNATKPAHWANNPIVCLNCGGINVHVMMWVNTATGEVDWRETALDLYTDPKSSGLTASWCKDCDEDHGTSLLSELVQPLALFAVLCSDR